MCMNPIHRILTVADEHGGKLKNRVVFYCDELGSCPPIQSLELMFSASRSRRMMLVPIVQSITGQLQKNYGQEGSEIIVYRQCESRSPFSRITSNLNSNAALRPRYRCKQTIITRALLRERLFYVWGMEKSK